MAPRRGIVKERAFMTRDASRRLTLAKRAARAVLSAGGTMAVAAAAAQAFGTPCDGSGSDGGSGSDSDAEEGAVVDAAGVEPAAAAGGSSGQAPPGCAAGAAAAGTAAAGPAGAAAAADAEVDAAAAAAALGECSIEDNGRNTLWHASLDLREDPGDAAALVTLRASGATEDAAKAALAEVLHQRVFGRPIASNPEENGDYNSPLGFLESIRMEAEEAEGMPDSMTAALTWEALYEALSTLRTATGMERLAGR